QPGDIILCCYASSRANHAGIYLGNQTILHHIPNQLSKREEYNERWQRMTHSIWRYRDWQPSDFTGICNDLDVALI
ncbi:TPA: NlpC/P60 family protein, partial [Proteus mirabilis]